MLTLRLLLFVTSTNFNDLVHKILAVTNFSVLGLIMIPYNTQHEAARYIRMAAASSSVSMGPALWLQ